MSPDERAKLDVLLRSYEARTPTVVIDSHAATGLPLPILDPPDPGIRSSVVVPAGTFTSVHVSVNITHTFRGDLRVTLTSPSGQEFILTNQQGGGVDDFVLTNLDLGLSSSATVAGTWVLDVIDLAGGDIGQLNSWSIGLGRTTGAVIDLTIGLESNPAGDDNGNSQGQAGSEEQDRWERIIQHFADAVFEMTNGAHQVGQVRVFRGGRNFAATDIRWGMAGHPHVPRNGGVGVAGGHIMMYETFSGGSGSGGDLNLLADEIGSGYTMAHEWGHFYLGLYDEYTPHGCGATVAVAPSIMANQWAGRSGANRLDWLNFSIRRQTGGPFQNTESNCQHFAQGTGAWPVLARTPDEDPRDATSVAFRSLGPRLFYPELTLAAPVGAAVPRIDLPATAARSVLDIIWMENRTVFELVLDRSGSMSGNKLPQAKTAAKLLVDQAVIGTTRIGVTVFDHNVDNLVPVTLLDSEATRTAIKNAIDGVTLGGSTAIGDAAAAAHAKIVALTVSGENRVVFLLTDGQNNAGRDPLTVIPDYTAARLPLFTFGFGSDVDGAQLAQLATSTGARYYFSPTTLGEITAAFRDATQAATASSGLGNGTLSPTASAAAAVQIPVDASLERVQVAVVYDGTSPSPALQLRTPGGQSLSPSSSTVAGSETLLFFDVEAPSAGVWQLQAGTAAAGTAFRYSISGVQGRVGYAVSTGVRGGGLTVTTAGAIVVESRLTRRQPVANAAVIGTLTRPDGTSSQLLLVDNGVFPDLTAQDGNYAGVFFPSGSGSYQVSVQFSNPSLNARETYVGASLTPNVNGGQAPVPADVTITENFVRSETIQIAVQTEETTTPPAIVTHPGHLAIVPGPGAMATFSVAALGAPAPSYRWQRRVSGALAWHDVADGVLYGVTYAGASTPTLSITGVTGGMFGDQFRVVVTNDHGSVTSDAGRLRQASNTVSVNPSMLTFVATEGTVGRRPLTPPQRVVVSAPGTPAVTWTATADQPWVSISLGAGSGSNVFMVSMQNLESATAGTATITLSSPQAINSPQRIAVALSFIPASTTMAPIGRVDSPAQNLTNVQGAIAMTGWVVDDIGVARVRIYRQCLGLDNPAACQTVLGARVVFVGDASIVAGARPDVEAAFPTLPAANAAGWGFLILTNTLPHIPNGLPSGGVGTFQLYAVAADQEGHETLLGRTTQTSAPTTVTVANDTIAKPFGTIDTPGQGATVSGVLNNFGWVLTPDTPAPSTLMPIDGSTMTVFVDGAPVGTVQYNLCRGTVGNPVPVGVLCNDDVSNRFRGDGTRFRNLDPARGPIGLRAIDTTTLTNGLHTISWGVTDSANRVEGIGSRFFAVLNSVPDEAVTLAPRDLGTRLSQGYGGEAPELRDAGSTSLRGPAAPIWARTGFDLTTAYTPLEPNAEGVPQVRIPEHGRIELQIPGITGGSMIANGTVRALPIGVGIDRERGLVTWVAGAGYLGTYRLRFDVSESRGPEVDITVASASAVGDNVRMRVDRADVHGATFTLHGWALDPQASTGAGIGTVHVWGRRRVPDSGFGVQGSVGESNGPVFLGVAQLGQARPDVAAAHGAHIPYAGFVMHGVLPDAGEWEITAYVWVTRTGRFEDARTVTVRGR